jgi:hypothetical protein
MGNTIIEHYLKDIKEPTLCLNKRFIICIRPSSMFEECKIIEFSPSGKHVKLEYPNNYTPWKNIEDIYLVEELYANRKVKTPQSPPLDQPIQ